MKVALDTMHSTILDNPQAKVRLDKDIPTIHSNPLVAMAKWMTLNNLLAIHQTAQFGLTKD
jgi:hypothetical protein